MTQQDVDTLAADLRGVKQEIEEATRLIQQTHREFKNVMSKVESSIATLEAVLYVVNERHVDETAVDLAACAQFPASVGDGFAGGL